MKILHNRGIALTTYKEAKEKNDIGIYQCGGKEIDDDTVIIYEMFNEQIEETGSLAKDHELATLWLCTAHVFCKCGEYHNIKEDCPIEHQIINILMDIHRQTGIKFIIPSPNEDLEGLKIVPILQIETVKKRVADIKKWL